MNQPNSPSVLHLLPPDDKKHAGIIRKVEGQYVVTLKEAIKSHDGKSLPKEVKVTPLVAAKSSEYFTEGQEVMVTIDKEYPDRAQSIKSKDKDQASSSQQGSSQAPTESS